MCAETHSNQATFAHCTRLNIKMCTSQTANCSVHYGKFYFIGNFICIGKPVVFNKQKDNKIFLVSVRHHNMLFYFILMKTCFGLLTTIKVHVPYFKFCKDGLMMVECSKHVVIKIK